MVELEGFESWEFLSNYSIKTLENHLAGRKHNAECFALYEDENDPDYGPTLEVLREGVMKW